MIEWLYDLRGVSFATANDWLIGGHHGNPDFRRIMTAVYSCLLTDWTDDQKVDFVGKVARAWFPSLTVEDFTVENRELIAGPHIWISWGLTLIRPDKAKGMIFPSLLARFQDRLTEAVIVEWDRADGARQKSDLC